MSETAEQTPAPSIASHIRRDNEGNPYLAGSKCSDCGHIFVGERSVCAKCYSRTGLDADGNIACGTHSSSSESYGSGVYVGGIIVNRPVFLRKYRNMPAGISTAQWVFKDGKPVYAMATPSRSYLEAVLQATANTFE